MLSGSRLLACETLRLALGFGQLSVRQHHSTSVMARTRAQKAAEVVLVTAAAPPVEAVLSTEVANEPDVLNGAKRKAKSSARPVKRSRKQLSHETQPGSVTETEMHSQAKAQPKRRRAKPKKESVALKTEYDVELATTEQDAEVLRHSTCSVSVVKLHSCCV